MPMESGIISFPSAGFTVSRSTISRIGLNRRQGRENTAGYRMRASCKLRERGLTPDKANLCSP